MEPVNLLIKSRDGLVVVGVKSVVDWVICCMMMEVNKTKQKECPRKSCWGDEKFWLVPSGYTDYEQMERKITGNWLTGFIFRMAIKVVFFVCDGLG